LRRRRDTPNLNVRWNFAWPGVPLVLLRLSPDIDTGMGRLAQVPRSGHAHAAAGFAWVQDPEQKYAAALTNLVAAAGDERLRWFWIRCLGRLGPQAAEVSPHLRDWAERDPILKVRHEAIQSLGGVDSSPATLEFLRKRYRDPGDRSAVMAAFLRMGVKAKPAEDLIREATLDRDMHTAMFARWALNSVEGKTNVFSTGKE